MAGAARELWQEFARRPPGRIAVSPLEAVGGEDAARMARLVEELLAVELTRRAAGRKGAGVIETGRVRAAVTEELEKGLSDMADARGQARLGRFLSARVLVAGSVTVTGDRATAALRAVDVETTRVLAAASASFGVPGTPASRPLALEASLWREVVLQGGSTEAVPLRPGARLHSGDKVQVRFRPSRDCYAYLLLYSGGDDQAARHFPRDDIAIDNHVRGGVEYRIPGAEEWFELDQATGSETVYLLLADEPMDDIDRLLEDMRSAPRGTAAHKDRRFEAYARDRGFTSATPGSGVTTGAVSPGQEEEIGKVTGVVREAQRVMWSLTFLHEP